VHTVPLQMQGETDRNIEQKKDDLPLLPSDQIILLNEKQNHRHSAPASFCQDGRCAEFSLANSFPDAGDRILFFLFFFDPDGSIPL